MRKWGIISCGVLLALISTHSTLVFAGPNSISVFSADFVAESGKKHGIEGASTLRAVQAECNGKHDPCAFPVTNGWFEAHDPWHGYADPAKLTHKILTVIWQCLPGDKSFHRADIDEGSTARLVCN